MYFCKTATLPSSHQPYDLFWIWSASRGRKQQVFSEASLRGVELDVVSSELPPGLGPSVSPAGCRLLPRGSPVLQGGEHKWTLGSENLYMSGVTLECSGKGFSARRDSCEDRYREREMDLVMDI